MFKKKKISKAFPCFVFLSFVRVCVHALGFAGTFHGFKDLYEKYNHFRMSP